MKYLIYLLIAMLLTLAMMSCSTSRRSIHSQRTKDSVNISSSATVQNTISSERIRIKDTTLTFAPKYTQGIVRPQDLTPLYDATGKPQPRTIATSKNGLTAKLTINADSSATFSATMDSFVLVVQNLIDRTSTLEHQLQSTSAVKETVKETISYTELAKKSGTFIAGVWQWLLLAAVLIFFPTILDLLKKFYSFIKR